MRTRSQRSQRSDGSPENSPMPPASLASLPEAVLEHALTFVDENQDARCRAISQSWARLRRVWVLHYPQIGRDQRGQVTAVAFSPDGSLLAVGAEVNPPVMLYDAATGDLRRALSRGAREHWRDYAKCFAFTPDGTVLATGCSGKICLYNVATGESSDLFFTTERLSADVTSVAFSPDGNNLAFCHDRMAAIVGIGGWIKSPRVLATSDFYNRIKGVAFSPTGSVLAVGVGPTVKCFDVSSGQPRLEIEYNVAICSVAFSSRGTVAVGGCGKLTFYDGSTGRLQQELRPDFLDGRASFVNTLCFSPDGSIIAASTTENSRSKSIDIYDAETGELLLAIGRACLGIKAAAFSADGKSIALGDWVSLRGGGKLTLYDVETLDLRRMQRQPQASPAAPTA